MAANVSACDGAGNMKPRPLPRDRTKLRKQNHNTTLNPALAYAHCWQLAISSTVTEWSVLIVFYFSKFSAPACPVGRYTNLSQCTLNCPRAIFFVFVVRKILHGTKTLSSWLISPRSRVFNFLNSISLCRPLNSPRKENVVTLVKALREVVL